MADQRTILSVIPVEDFKFKKTDQTSYENIYLFQGSENNLKLSKTHDTKFLCQYDMAWYPFDTQICTMDIVLNIVQVESSDGHLTVNMNTSGTHVEMLQGIVYLSLAPISYPIK